MANSDFPRRAKLYLSTPSEIAITNAIIEIERLGADTRLTEAQILLDKARTLVSNWIDEEIK